jgi:hypothetical protein
VESYTLCSVERRGGSCGKEGKNYEELEYKEPLFVILLEKFVNKLK